MNEDLLCEILEKLEEYYDKNPLDVSDQVRRDINYIIINSSDNYHW